MNIHAELVKKLYAPSSASMAKSLPDIGKGLEAAFRELSRNLSPEQCEQMSQRLQAAGHAVSLLRATLLAEGSQ